MPLELIAQILTYIVAMQKANRSLCHTCKNVAFLHPPRRAAYIAFLRLFFNTFISTLKSSRDTDAKVL